MDDPTKDTIPRSAVEYYLRKETVNTNPEAYESHESFIAYMDDPDISQFGHWMHSNGFNCALVSIAVDLGKIPSAQPGWIPVTERLPEEGAQDEVTTMTEKDLDIAIEKCERIMEFDTRTLKNPESDNGWIFDKVYDLLKFLRQIRGEEIK